MNHPDFCLQRLFRAAARASRELPAEAPFPLEARVLSAWRHGAPEVASSSPPTPLLRAALAGACAILAISAALTLGWPGEIIPANELIAVDSVIQLTFLQ